MSNALFPPCAQLNLYITQGMPSKFIFSYLRGCFSLRHSFCLACLDATNPNHWKEKTIHIVEEHKTSTVKECPWEGADATLKIKTPAHSLPVPLMMKANFIKVTAVDFLQLHQCHPAKQDQ